MRRSVLAFALAALCALGAAPASAQNRTVVVYTAGPELVRALAPTASCEVEAGVMRMEFVLPSITPTHPAAEPPREASLYRLLTLVAKGVFEWRARWQRLGERLLWGDAAGPTPEVVETAAAAELDDDAVAATAFYTATLGVPARAPGDVAAGEARFTAFGCAACHTPVQRTAAAPIPALADQTFAPYTDLLLHDLGDGLADGRPEFAADGREWRTPPLWGTRDSGPWLHDGRAATLDEAVRLHAGEGAASATKYTSMPMTDQQLVGAASTGVLRQVQFGLRRRRRVRGVVVAVGQFLQTEKGSAGLDL